MILRTRLSLYFHLYPLKARLAVLGLFLGVVVLLVGGGRLVSRISNVMNVFEGDRFG
jgi:membrane-associated PAP2 superfamily phosphatase